MAEVKDDLRKLKQIIPEEKDFSAFVNLFRSINKIGIREQNDKTGQFYEVVKFGFKSSSESQLVSETRRENEWFASPYTKHTEITRTWHDRLCNTMMSIIQSGKGKQISKTYIQLLVYKDPEEFISRPTYIVGDRERVTKGTGDRYAFRKIGFKHACIGERLQINVIDGEKNLDDIVTSVINWMFDTIKNCEKQLSSLAPFPEEDPDEVSDEQDSAAISKKKGCTVC